jgi:hypothetical protein
MNLQSIGDRLHFDALQLTELHRLELELQAVPLNFPRARSGHLTPPALGGSVYFIEGRSAVRCSGLLASHEVQTGYIGNRLNREHG